MRLRRFPAIKRFVSNWLPVVGLCLLIFIESSGPLPDLAPEVPMLDKVLHFLAWAVLGFLFFRAYAGTPSLAPHRKIRTWKNGLIWISFFSAALYGVSDEVHQYFVPFRSADTMDVLADIIGSLCGAFGGAQWYRIFRKSASGSGHPSKRASVDQIH